MRVLLRVFLLHAPLLFSLGIHYGNLIRAEFELRLYRCWLKR